MRDGTQKKYKTKPKNNKMENFKRYIYFSFLLKLINRKRTIHSGFYLDIFINSISLFHTKKKNQKPKQIKTETWREAVI